ncbi:hypothetical protein GQ600_10400 [Phytophthora cactorum]|nr:hypothetical protein GQ600_10400 [Phytophthora cactorum]
MLSTIQIAVVAAAFLHGAHPNGENIGKTLGHTGTGYTDFGTLFSDDGTEWSKVCSQTWPGGSVTCGEALGDPCCTWKSGDPDYTLTEPNTDGTTVRRAPLQPAAPPPAQPPDSRHRTTEASGTTDDSTTQASNTTDNTAVTDSSEYCE